MTDSTVPPSRPAGTPAPVSGGGPVAAGPERGASPLRRPHTLGGVVYLLVCLVTIVGLALVVFVNWRHGITVVGAGLVGGALVRSFLGEYEAGMLRVRRRWFDVLVMAGVGAVLILLALTIPDQPA